MNSPVILEKGNSHLIGLDLSSKLMQQRIIMLDEEITDEFANQIITQLLYLKSISKEDITIIVNGPGGSVYAGLAIYDMISSIKNDGIIIKTRGIGYACSMQSLLLASGSLGERKVYPNTTIMIHQPMGGAHGQVSDIEIAANEVIRLKNKLYKLYLDNGGNFSQDIMDRDKWLEPKDAIKLGLIDEII